MYNSGDVLFLPLHTQICAMVNKRLNSLVNSGALFIHSDVPLSALSFSFEQEEKPTYTVKDGIAHIAINDYLYLGNEAGAVQSYVDLLSEIKASDSIRGVVVELYSGGGQDTASDYLGNAIAEVSAIKPVVAYGHLMASGAYLAAVNANIIVASSGISRFGSIGSYIPLDRFYRDIYATFMNDVYAEQSSDKNAEFREWVNEDATTKYQERANASAGYFISKVRMKRPYVSEEAYKGGLFDADRAKQFGLIDGIGTLDYAFSRVGLKGA